MQVILKGFVDNLGDAGDIVDVANGYATNFLIPQNLAMRATTGRGRRCPGAHEVTHEARGRRDCRG